MASESVDHNVQAANLASIVLKCGGEEICPVIVPPADIETECIVREVDWTEFIVDECAGLQERVWEGGLWGRAVEVERWFGRRGGWNVEREWGGLVTDEDIYFLADFGRELEEGKEFRIGG